MDTKKTIFTAKSEDGTLHEYEIIFKFYSDETHKNYLVYTDHSKKGDNMNVFAGTYDPTGKMKKILPIETDKEWNTIEAFLSKLEEFKNEKKEN